MRAFVSACVVFAVVVGIGAALSAQQSPSADPAPPAIHAKAAFVLDANTGKALYSLNPDLPLPPASTTKILTGLLFSRAVAPRSAVKASPAASAVPGSRLGMRPGETFAARDILRAIMLHSANDASAAAAEASDGSVDKFVSRMNAEARRLGATHSHFVNPHGLPAPGHLSTARDLAHIAREALRNPEFASAARTKTHTVLRGDGALPTHLTNTNDLLWSYPGADGVKTGWTREAGYCFVGSATRRGRRIITVVLNSPDWKRETAALMNYGFARLHVSPEANKPASKGGAGTESSSGTSHSPGSGTSLSPASGTSHSAQTGTPDEDVPDNVTASASSPAQTKSPTSPVPPASQSPPASTSQGSGNRAAGGGSPAQGVRNVNGSPRTPLSAPGRSNANATSPTSYHPISVLTSGAATKSASRPTSYGSPDLTGMRAVPPLPARVVNGAAAPVTSSRFLAGPVTPKGHRSAWPWLLLLLAILLLLIAAKRRRRTNGNQDMRNNGSGLFGLLGRSGRRRDEDTRDDHSPRESSPRRSSDDEAHPFPPTAPMRSRRPSREWLNEVLDAPNLLEPAIRRQARSQVEADPHVWDAKLDGLLASTNPKVRLAGADMMASRSPRRAEETLLELADDAGVSADIREDAVRKLSVLGGDRHESTYLRALLTHASPEAARALALLPRMDNPTTVALRRNVDVHPAQEGDESPAALLAAQSACVLAVHGAIPSEEATERLARLPQAARSAVIVGTLQGVPSEWAIDRLLDAAIDGGSASALRALPDSGPRRVRERLEARDPAAEPSAHADVVRWTLTGQGDAEGIGRDAESGDSLAAAARDLHRDRGYELMNADPEALQAAAQIVSIRLGYSPYSKERVSEAFAAATAGGPFNEHPGMPSELAALAHSYTRPEVRDAVHAALHTDDGLDRLLGELARRPDRENYVQEMAFWTDKTPAPTRLLLVNALAEYDTPAARAAIAARTDDADPAVRAAAERLSRVFRDSPMPVAPVEPAGDTVPMKQAA